MTKRVASFQTPTVQFVITTGTDDSWYWGVSPIEFVCAQCVAVEDPAVIATAEPVNDVWIGEPCETHGVRFKMTRHGWVQR